MSYDIKSYLINHQPSLWCRYFSLHLPECGHGHRGGHLEVVLVVIEVGGNEVVLARQLVTGRLRPRESRRDNNILMDDQKDGQRLREMTTTPRDRKKRNKTACLCDRLVKYVGEVVPSLLNQMIMKCQRRLRETNTCIHATSPRKICNP